MNQGKSVIIIGAGIAGLSTGCYLQMNGFNTEIFEMGKTPGGLCTAWKRKGYTFDGCLHWLVGSSPTDNLCTIWNELGVLRNRGVVNFSEYTRIETYDGKVFPVYTDMDRLSREMKTVAPEDSNAINQFIRSVKRFSRFNTTFKKPRELFTAADTITFLLKNISFLALYKKYQPVSIQEYSLRFSNPFLRSVLLSILGEEKVSVLALMMVLSWFHKKSAGYLVGGSQGLAQAIEKRYLNLGGKINYNSRVSSILSENNVATGVELEKGGTYHADNIISTCDGNSTIFRLLKGKYTNKKIIDMYNTMDLFPSLIQVSLGVTRSCHDLPHALTLCLERPILADDKTKVESINVTVYNFDPTLAPEGKTSIAVTFPANYEYWLNLRNNQARKYLMEKERIAVEVIGILEKRLGDIAHKVEAYDVATPATYIRYTANWRGSFEGWLPTPSAMEMTIDKTLPGLNNFYMAGQWVEPGGGIPSAAMSARQVAQLLCNKEKIKFKTTMLE